jgi:hypothetical protein
MEEASKSPWPVRRAREPLSIEQWKRMVASAPCNLVSATAMDEHHHFAMYLFRPL